MIINMVAQYSNLWLNNIIFYIYYELNIKNRMQYKNFHLKKYIIIPKLIYNFIINKFIKMQTE